MLVDKHFSENVLLSMEKLIKFAQMENSVHAVGSHESSRTYLYCTSLDDRKFGSFLFSFIPIENVYISN